MATAKFYGTGRRKKSIARVYLVPGTGKITINKRDIDEKLRSQEYDNLDGMIADVKKQYDIVIEAIAALG